MKPLQTYQQKQENFTKKCVCATIITTFIIFLITVSGVISFSFICIYDNKSKYREITSAVNETNNIKKESYIHVCFNSSDSESYSFIIQQLNELFERDYCYDVNIINNFELKCKEMSFYKFLHEFTISSSQIIRYHNRCLKNLSHQHYGYKNSQPCVVFVYFNKNLHYRQMFYKFPILITIKPNFSKRIDCDLIYKEKNNKINNKTEILTTFHLFIENGQCSKTMQSNNHWGHPQVQ